MRLLVTGAAGMLGQDVVGAGERAGHEVVGLGRDALDVSEETAAGRVVRELAPDAIVNCAAYTNVDGAQSDPEGAEAVNRHGARHVARAAAQVGAMVIHVSTDYVFDGRKDGAYLESDPTHPLSVYGASKLRGEQEVAAATPRHVIARSAWLFGSGGRNFVSTMLALAEEREEVNVVDDQVGCPTWTGHLAPVLVGLAGEEQTGVHHLAASGECSWHAFAQEIFTTAGVACRVLRSRSADLDRPAPRPANSVLLTTRGAAPPLPHWRNGLGAYLLERAELTAR